MPTRYGLLLALALPALPCFAQTQSANESTPGTQASPIPYGPILPLGLSNIYNPNLGASVATPFGMGSPAGTRFGPDPQIGGGAAPTDVNGSPNTPTTRTGYEEEQRQTGPEQPKKKKPKKKPQDNRQSGADPELPAAEDAEHALARPAPTAGELPQDDPFAR